MKAYREWLPADGYEGTGSLGGSYYSDDIADYYLTPHDLGYWPFVKFDHDFVGREALEAMADEPRRKKVTLAWNGEDVAHAIGTLFEKGDPAKYIDFPLSNYATWPYDKLLQDGELVGVSTFSGYSYNERSYLSLAMVDSDVELGTEVTLVWGEEGGGSSKPVVERHVQTEIRAIVSPVPVLRGRAHLVPRGLAHESRSRVAVRSCMQPVDAMARTARHLAAESTCCIHAPMPRLICSAPVGNLAAVRALGERGDIGRFGRYRVSPIRQSKCNVSVVGQA